MYFGLALITVAWKVWLAWFTMFLVVEFGFLALRRWYPDTNNTGGTLSELVWYLIRGHAWWHRLLYWSSLGFFIDLGFHFFVGTSLF